jgi:hypothetical protein
VLIVIGIMYSANYFTDTSTIIAKPICDRLAQLFTHSDAIYLLLAILVIELLRRCHDLSRILRERQQQ